MKDTQVLSVRELEQTLEAADAVRPGTQDRSVRSNVRDQGIIWLCVLGVPALFAVYFIARLLGFQL